MWKIAEIDKETSKIVKLLDNVYKHDQLFEIQKKAFSMKSSSGNTRFVVVQEFAWNL